MNYLKILFLILFIIPIVGFAQDQDSTTVVQPIKRKFQRPAFENSQTIDNQTNVVFIKNTLEAVIQHRFGLISGGINDLSGIWAPSNIRIGLTYSLTNRLAVGFGTTKDNRLQDFNLKGVLLRQTVTNKMPVSVTYYGNMAVDARKRENFNHLYDRYSFFNQLIIARRFSDAISLQIAPSLSHYNIVESTLKNDMLGIAFGGRVKISPQTSILFDYSQPLSHFDASKQPKAGLGVGVEFATSAHVFQIFVSNNRGLVPQKDYMYNQNDFFKGDFAVGFSITRRYNF